MILSNRIEDITKEEILSLVENRVEEGAKIEYKALLSLGTSSEKKEFLADVSAFANSSGGDLIVGIEEDEGIPTEAIGVSGINPDAYKIQLEQIVLSNIAPKIPGLRIQAIQGFPEGPVLVIRIPKSWAGPHMVTIGQSRFFVRSNARKRPLDVAEIRSAFLQSESLPEKIRSFRQERVGKILSGETPALLKEGPKMILHVIPAIAFSTGFSLDAGSLKAERENLVPISLGANQIRFNLDGMISCDGYPEQGGFSEYCQAFRNGIIETVDSAILAEINREYRILCVRCEMDVIVAFDSYRKALENLEIPPPYAIALSFVSVLDYVLDIPLNYSKPYGLIPLTSDVLMIPEVVVEDLDKPSHTILRPIFDALWNAAGFERSWSYDSEGNWKP
jgi:hypothetical protein